MKCRKQRFCFPAQNVHRSEILLTLIDGDSLLSGLRCRTFDCENEILSMNFSAAGRTIDSSRRNLKSHPIGINGLTRVCNVASGDFRPVELKVTRWIGFMTPSKPFLRFDESTRNKTSFCSTSAAATCVIPSFVSHASTEWATSRVFSLPLKAIVKGLANEWENLIPHNGWLLT